MIKIITADNQHFEINYDDSLSVERIKAFVEQKVWVPIEAFRLSMEGRLLTDSEQVQEGSTLYLDFDKETK